MAKKILAQSTKPLARRVALVAGATRGAGRGIARALGEAGATVYCTGRSVKGRPSPYKRPETIDETAAMINAAGGNAIAVRVDHTVESEVKALFGRIARKHKRVDILVNSIAGEDPLMGQWGHFWQANLKDADTIFRQALTSRIITAKHAALLMMRRRSGLIVEVTENDILGGGGNPMAQAVKMADKVLALNWAAELKPHRVAVRRGDAGVPAVREDAGAFRRHRGELARRGEEGSELPASRNRRCSSAARSPRSRPIRDVMEQTGSC